MPLVPGSTPWNASLHPRQSGGRFGQSNNQTAVNSHGNLAGQLRERAKDFRKRAQEIEAQIKSIRAQIASLRSSTTHSHTAHSSKAKSAKGAKSGIAKKTTTKTAKKATSATSTAASKSKQISQLQGKMVMLRGERDVLLKRAGEMDAQAGKLSQPGRQ